MTLPDSRFHDLALTGCFVIAVLMLFVLANMTVWALTLIK